MTKREELNAVADRCEREEASPYLASAILVACGHQTLFRGPVLGWEWRPEGKGVWRSMPRPDTSLDAAVTLVPKLARWSLSQGDRFVVSVHDRTALFRGDRYEAVGSSHLATLALCAAALRARAALVVSPSSPPKGRE